MIAHMDEQRNGDGFNPRPPLRAGDGETERLNRMTKEFQSTPALAGGRWAADALERLTAVVSIHARPCGRAMCDNVLHLTSEVCFNPRPPLRAGDESAPIPTLANN